MCKGCNESCGKVYHAPKANYIAVRGQGDHNEEGGLFQQAISFLY